MQYKLELYGLKNNNEYNEYVSIHKSTDMKEYLVKWAWNTDQKEWVEKNCSNYELLVKQKQREPRNSILVPCKSWSLWIDFKDEEEALYFSLRWL